MIKRILISEALSKQAISDLERSHPFAFERIGFFICTRKEMDLIATEWLSIDDNHYWEDYSVGACIGELGMEAIMQKAYSSQACFFHYHLHEFQKSPSFSFVDLDSLSKDMVPSIYRFSKQGPHGGLVKGSKCHKAIYFSKDGKQQFNLKVLIGEVEVYE